jgi:hypothetical protein
VCCSITKISFSNNFTIVWSLLVPDFAIGIAARPRIISPRASIHRRQVIYLGIAAATNDLWLLPLTVPLLIVIRYGVIGREERYLTVMFGEEYRQYRERVRRWV